MSRFNPAGKCRPRDNDQGRNRLIDEMFRAQGLPIPVHEYAFAEEIGRKWRWDLLVSDWLAIELQGGIHIGGRHVRGSALEKEYEKLNYGVILGYSVLFFTPEQLNDGSAFPIIRMALAGEPGELQPEGCLSDPDAAGAILDAPEGE